MAELNLLAVGVRQIVRSTVGAKLKAQQDRTANLAKIDEVLGWRPRNLKPLSEQDFRLVARKRNLPPIVLDVLATKESGRDGGFQRDGRITIAVEPQHFSKNSAGAFDISNPEFSYPKWVPLSDQKTEAAKLPKAFVNTWGKHPIRLDHKERWQLWCMQAEAHFDAAICGVSMGRFQVMGFHWSAMGFESPMDMLRFAYEGEANHLELCLRWFDMEDKIDALRRKDWAVIASYNGSGNLKAYAADCAKIHDKRCSIYA